MTRKSIDADLCALPGRALPGALRRASRSRTGTLALVAALCVGPAGAGTLDHGNWTPSGCGPEPRPPAGLNLTSKDAYAESMRWVKSYQDEYTRFSDCMTKEADEDNAGINDYVRASQQRAQEFFDEVSADNKRARSALSGNASGVSVGQRVRPGSGPDPDQ